MTCERCYQPADVGEHGLYLCPLEPRRSAAVWADDIPGGLVIHHGLCHEDGSGRRFNSRSEIRAACKEKNLIPWTDAYTEDKVKPSQQFADYRDRAPECQAERRDKKADRARRQRGERL